MWRLKQVVGSLLPGALLVRWQIGKPRRKMPASRNEAKFRTHAKTTMHLKMMASAIAAADTFKWFSAAAVVLLTLAAHPASAAGTTARDCISFEETDVDDVLTYHNDCNRTVIFYYCVIDPQRTEVAPCRRVLAGTRRVRIYSAQGQTFLTQEMEPGTSYDVKLWGGTKIKWAACDAELGGLEIVSA